MTRIFWAAIGIALIALAWAKLIHPVHRHHPDASEEELLGADGGAQATTCDVSGVVVHWA